MSPPFPRGRPRSLSVSSGESSGSASSPNEIPTPLSTSAASPRVHIPSPGTSPILAYFLAQSPTKTPGAATFPFRKLARHLCSKRTKEEEMQRRSPAASHARRASTAVAERFTQAPTNNALPDSRNERGQGLLRRLSLSQQRLHPTDGKRSPPNAPPNTAVSPTQSSSSLPFGGRERDSKPRRSATLSSAEGRPRRAPSPMGERILKGHFDGFN
ncbi:hypothetical protein C8R46DRAFT_1162912 [Mycena filopes]|nr:hypothetical protein C8R46DRAFT_1162912 [Mycena filopes]